MRPATGSRGSTSPRHRSGARASSRTSVGSPSRSRISAAPIVSSSRTWAANGARSTRGLVGLQRALVGAEVDRAGRVVAQVAQEPPAARGPAAPLVEGEHERLRADPGSGEDGAERVRVGKRMAAAHGRIGRRGGEHRLRVEMDGAGDVPRLVGVARPAVQEAHAHSAPRGETASSSTSWSGKRAFRAAAQAGGSSAHTMTVGPEPESVAPRAPSGRSARTDSRASEAR